MTVVNSKTKHMTLKPLVNNMSVMWWFICASVFTHIDMKEYTRGMQKLGKGAVNSKAVRQKVNINSSTIIELIGACDMVPEVLWINISSKLKATKWKHHCYAR